MAYRRKDADKVYSEIVEMSKTYRCLLIGGDGQYLREQVLPRNSSRSWPTWAQIYKFIISVKANLRREQLSLMAEAGIESIQPGIESFNSRLLQLMRKGVSAIQNIQLLKWCQEIGIHVCYNVLYGFPQETPDDYGNLPTMFCMLSHLQPPGSMVPVTIERFSPYFFDKERFKLQYRPRPEYDYIYPTPRVDIPKVAYFFHGSWADQAGEPDEYVAPARASLKEWKTHAAHEKIFCHYEKGPDYVRVHDNRPHRPAGPLLSRTVDLKRNSSLRSSCSATRTTRSRRS